MPRIAIKNAVDCKTATKTQPIKVNESRSNSEYLE